MKGLGWVYETQSSHVAHIVHNVGARWDGMAEAARHANGQEGGRAASSRLGWTEGAMGRGTSDEGTKGPRLRSGASR